MTFLSYAYRFTSNFVFLALVYFSLNFMEKYEHRAIVSILVLVYAGMHAATALRSFYFFQRIERLEGEARRLASIAVEGPSASNARKQIVSEVSGLRHAGDPCRNGGRKRGSGLLLAQRVERCPDLGREQFGLFPGGEVAAPGGFVEVGEGGVGVFDPGTRGSDALAGELGESDRDRDRRLSLSGGTIGGLSVFPVPPRRRGPGARQPVQGDVVEDVVSGQIARGLAVDEGARDLVVAVGVVVEHPGREGDRGIEQGVADRLGPRGLLGEVPEAGLPGGRILLDGGAFPGTL